AQMLALIEDERAALVEEEALWRRQEAWDLEPPEETSWPELRPLDETWQTMERRLLLLDRQVDAKIRLLLRLEKRATSATRNSSDTREPCSAEWSLNSAALAQAGEKPQSYNTTPRDLAAGGGSAESLLLRLCGLSTGGAGEGCSGGFIPPARGGVKPPLREPGGGPPPRERASVLPPHLSRGVCPERSRRAGHPLPCGAREREFDHNPLLPGEGVRRSRTGEGLQNRGTKPSKPLESTAGAIGTVWAGSPCPGNRAAADLPVCE
ncbi:MAG: hypothetical protein ACRD1I_08955, partial [Terriglobia bacterium]